MTQGQPPGWGPPGSAPPAPGWPPPDPPQAHGGQQPPQAQAQGWQQPQQPQAWQQPQQAQGWQQPQGHPQPQAQAWQQPHAPQPAQGWASAPGQAGFGGAVAVAAAAPKKIGLFDAIPCPHCGASMSSSAGTGAMAGRMVGGLVGWLLVSALASKYYCPTHGEVAKSQLPAAHHSVATMRMIAMLLGAGSLLVVVFGCLILSAVLQGLR